MKKLLFILLIFITVNVIGQEEKELPNITETERIIDKYSEKVTQGVINIVENLKEPAQEVFNSVVRLQKAKGLALLIFSFFGWSLFLFLLISAIRTDWYNDIEGFPIFMSLVGIIAGGLCLYWGLLYTMAPEWYAIMELADLVK